MGDSPIRRKTLKQPTRNLNPNPPLQPQSCGTQQSDAERLRKENVILRAENDELKKLNFAQRHALKELNKAIAFTFHTLGQPMRVRGLNRPAKKMRKAQ
jgi:transposase-like protein